MRFTALQDRLIAAVIDHAKVIGDKDTDTYVAAIEHVTDNDNVLADRLRRELAEEGTDGYALSQYVVGQARMVARAVMEDGSYDGGADTPLLYRVVRSTLGRAQVCEDIDNPTVDDESISEGIVKAINERTSNVN